MKYTLIALLSLIGGITFGHIFDNTVLTKNQVEIQEFVYEDFYVSGTHNVDGKNERVTAVSLNNNGGFYMDSSVETIDEYKVGDTIRVTFLKEDYDNGIWDNFTKIEIIN